MKSTDLRRVVRRDRGCRIRHGQSDPRSQGRDEREGGHVEDGDERMYTRGDELHPHTEGDDVLVGGDGEEDEPDGLLRGGQAQGDTLEDGVQGQGQDHQEAAQSRLKQSRSFFRYSRAMMTFGPLCFCCYCCGRGS